MGYLDSLAQGLRLGGGVLNPQVQQMNQQNEITDQNALRQRQQFLIAQALRAAETGAADPMQVQQFLKQQGVNVPESFVGPDQATQALQQALKNEQAFRAALQANPNATFEDRARIATEFGKPELAVQYQKAVEDRAARKEEAQGRAQQAADMLDFRKSQLDQQYQLGLQSITNAQQRQAFEQWYKTESLKNDAERNRQAAEFKRMGLELRQPPAPAMAEIVDPTNPTQMLRIDARTYRSGGVGSPGVIGVSGKEPMAAKREETRGTGREQVDTMIAQLKDSYEQLATSGGITSTSSDPLSNAVAAAASSGVGQAIGKTFGTQNQSLRNQIMQSRPLLLAAIKNATGMSARQMDSNVELKLYLSAATDPTLDIQANIAALEQLDKLFGSGAKSNAAKPTAAKPKSSVKPPPGFVED